MNTKKIFETQHILRAVLPVMFLIFSGMSVQAQDLDFTLTSDTVNAQEQDIPLSSTLEKMEGTLVWTQNANGQTKETNFTIIETTTSDWNTQTNSGLITYEMVRDEISCRFTLVGQASTMTATLTIDPQTAGERQYVFNVTLITNQ